MADVASATEYKAARTALLKGAEKSGAVPLLAGLELVSSLTNLTLSFIRRVASAVEWSDGWALIAVGGTGRQELCPGSDVDLLLLHPRKATDSQIVGLTDRLWYPMWDAGLSIAPGVHTVETAVDLADREILSAVAWMDALHLWGDAAATSRFVSVTSLSRAKHAKAHLTELAAVTATRHERAGDTAFLLGPDLRDGHGGLRDVLVVRFVESLQLANAAVVLERDPALLNDSRDVLLGVRAELHRTTGRNHDVLALQEQDTVAAQLRYPDADSLLGAVAAAARTVAWSCDETLRRVERHVTRQRPFRVSHRLRLSSDISVDRGELTLDDAAPVARDSSLILRVAALSALQGFPIARTTLQRLAAEAPQMSDPWTDRARQALVALLGAGRVTVDVFEALDQYRLMERVLPEWATVRSKPQRNAYHRFTVDRHLVEAAVNASGLVRSVARPDLLLIGTWLHDIGKGYRGDHTDVGVVLIDAIARRMGFDDAEVETLRTLVRHHLLLPETATRRDLSDPSVIENTANQVGDVDTLHLLRALTEADSIATGPTAWSHWKAQLCDDLVHRVERVLSGHRPPEPKLPSGAATLAALDDVRSGSDLSLRSEPDPDAPELELVTMAALDRTGLFSALSGSLAVNGVEVLGADVWTTDDGIALDLLRVTRRLGGETDWKRVERMLRGSLVGSVDLRAELAKRARSYQQRNEVVGAAPEVLVDDGIEARATVVEVRSPDMLGLLHRIAATLTALGLDIRTAKVTTLGHEVVDSFSVVRVLPDGTRAKNSPHGPTNDEVRTALLQELSAPPLSR